MAAARTSISNDSRIVKVPLPKSVLLKDYLIDDLSSCSSNGFRSYPRRPCCTKVRYLIEIDLNKHINLPPTQKKFVRRKSKLKPKSKSSSVLQKASAAVVNVFKHFQFSGSGERAKANFLPKNLSRKLSNWKRTIDRRNKEFNKRLNSFDEPVKEENKKKNVLRPPSKVSTAATTTAAEVNTSPSNSNKSASSESYFTITTTSVCSTTNCSSKINVAQNDVEECEQHTTENKNTANGMKSGVATAATDSDVITGNAKKEEESEKKEQFSPVSVMEFPCDDDEDEVTSPFQHSHLYAEGTKRKLLSKVQRVKSLANYNKLRPVRLEDRITLSESTTTTRDVLLHEEASDQTRKKATALLQQLKATMSSSNQFEFTQNVLLGFFIERIMEGSSVSNFSLLQEAKDWINGDGDAREITFESLVRDIDKEKVKWAKYDDEVEKQEVCLVLECQVFTSLVEEMLLEFYV